MNLIGSMMRDMTVDKFSNLIHTSTHLHKSHIQSMMSYMLSMDMCIIYITRTMKLCWSSHLCMMCTFLKFNIMKLLCNCSHSVCMVVNIVDIEFECNIECMERCIEYTKSRNLYTTRCYIAMCM